MKEKIQKLIDQLVEKVGDKKMHMLCCFLITFIVGLISVPFGIVAGCVAGLAKEGYDEYVSKTGGDPDDLVHDVIGVAIALVLLLLL